MSPRDTPVPTLRAAGPTGPGGAAREAAPGKARSRPSPPGSAPATHPAQGRRAVRSPTELPPTPRPRSRLPVFSGVLGRVRRSGAAGPAWPWRARLQSPTSNAAPCHPAEDYESRRALRPCLIPSRAALPRSTLGMVVRPTDQHPPPASIGVRGRPSKAAQPIAARACRVIQRAPSPGHRDSPLPTGLARPHRSQGWPQRGWVAGLPRGTLTCLAAASPARRHARSMARSGSRRGPREGALRGSCRRRLRPPLQRALRLRGRSRPARGRPRVTGLAWPMGGRARPARCARAGARARSGARARPGRNRIK